MMRDVSQTFGCSELERNLGSINVQVENEALRTDEMTGAVLPSTTATRHSG